MDTDMKVVNLIKDYLSFNKAERRGILVMVSIMTGLIIADVVVSEVMPEKRYDLRGFSEEIEAFEARVAKADSTERIKKQKTRISSHSSERESLPPVSEIQALKKEEWVIELNSADTLDLQRLRGIGPAFARRIVKYRERLGGYVDKYQLLEIFGMDPAKFEQIREHLFVKTDSLRRIDLNNATFKQMIAHPYFPAAIAKNVIIYRKENKRFSSVGELLKVPFINDSVYRKILPYVRVE